MKLHIVCFIALFVYFLLGYGPLVLKPTTWFVVNFDTVLQELLKNRKIHKPILNRLTAVHNKRGLLLLGLLALSLLCKYARHFYHPTSPLYHTIIL